MKQTGLKFTIALLMTISGIGNSWAEPGQPSGPSEESAKMLLGLCAGLGLSESLLQDRKCDNEHSPGSLQEQAGRVMVCGCQSGITGRLFPCEWMEVKPSSPGSEDQ